MGEQLSLEGFVSFALFRPELGVESPKAARHRSRPRHQVQGSLFEQRAGPAACRHPGWARYLAIWLSFPLPASVSSTAVRRDLKPPLRLVRSYEFAIICEQHLYAVPGFHSDLIRILDLGQPVTGERMAQGIVFPFDPGRPRQLPFLV